jgi:hypothetical protein
MKAGFWIKLCGVLLIIFTVLLLIFALETDQSRERATAEMGIGLIVLWVGLCGMIIRLYRNCICSVVKQLRFGWRTKFLAMTIIWALIEEAITTLMTNLAPAFGVPVGEAYITASADYLDVILFHSVVIFLPMFIAWAWLLGRWDFSPGAVMLLFGLSGMLAESISFGLNIVALPQWIFVYGLMIYLPAYCLPSDRGAKPPLRIHYPLAIILPILYAIPIAILVGLLHPISIHFLAG